MAAYNGPCSGRDSRPGLERSILFLSGSMLFLERSMLRTAAMRAGCRIAACLAACFAAAAWTSGCDAFTSVLVSGASFGGATADVHCDRREVADGGQPSAFCQEVVGTLGASQFADDCSHKLLATPGPGLCPRARVLAGCRLDAKTQDGSLVWDWYYDVSNVPATLPDGGPTFAPPVPFDPDAVGLVCADRDRYPDGAELTYP
jgi:hypothetical protein